MNLPSFLIAVVAFLLNCSWCLAEPLRIGVIVPLTGGLSEYGAAFRNGVNLAEAEDKDMSRKVRFLFEDSQYDNRLALTAFNKLSGPGGCTASFVWGSGPSESLAPLAQRRGYPLITIGEHTAALGRPSVITFTNPSVQFSSPLAKVLQMRGYRRIALVMTQITYFETLASNLKETLLPGQELSVISLHQPTDNDFKTTIARLRAAKPDALGVLLSSGQVSQFYRQLEAQNLKLPTFGSDIFESSTEIQQSGPGMNGALYAHNLAREDFRDRYISAYHSDAQLPTASRGYDFANLIAVAAESLKAVSGDNLLRSLEQMPPQRGASGEYKFVNSPVYGKYFEFPVVVKEIHNGKPRILKD